MNLHPVLLAHSYLSFSFFIFFLFQTFVSYLAFANDSINKNLSRNLFCLCLFTTTYTLICFLMIWKISIELNVFLIHLMWISGSMITYFYIGALKAYLNDSSKNLKYIRLLPLFGAISVAVFLILHVSFGMNFVQDAEVPFKHYESLYMTAIGGLNASKILGVFGLLTTYATIYTSIYFLRVIFRAKRPQKLLVVGIVLDIILLVHDLAPVLTDLAYVVPLMFLSNVFEISRLTHAVQMSMKQRLNQLSDNLIQTSKYSEIGNYYASLSHEILNPLFAAKGYLEMFIRKLPAEVIADDNYVQLIQKQHSKIEKLALNIRHYTKSSEDFSVVELNGVIQDAIETLALKARMNAVDIQHKGEVMDLACKKDQMIQVVTNLLNNSIDAIADRNEKWIRIEHGLDDENHVFIAVTDSGNGIPEDIGNKIWEQRFTTKDSGAGLGLGICAEIIRNHNGEIFLNRQSNNTQFKIRLPKN